MIALTYDQANEILKRLDRVQETAISIDEERLYWKGVAEVAATQATELEQQVRNLTRSCDELWRMYHQSEQARQEEAVFARGFLDRSMETIDEKNRQVERFAATVNDYADENVALREKLDMTCFLLDAIRKNLTTAGPWTDWHTKIALDRINVVLGAVKE